MTTEAMPRQRLSIRLPTAKPVEGTGAPAFAVDRPLVDLKVGLRHEGSWRSWMLIVDDWAERLRGDGARPFVVQTGERVGQEGVLTRESVDRWADDIDCAISGLGTCGSCTSWSVVDAVAVEARGKASIVAVTEEFEHHGHNMAAHVGHPNLKVLVFPYPLEGRPDQELRSIAAEYYPKFLELLGVTG